MKNIVDSFPSVTGYLGSTERWKVEVYMSEYTLLYDAIFSIKVVLQITKEFLIIGPLRLLRTLRLQRNNLKIVLIIWGP